MSYANSGIDVIVAKAAVLRLINVVNAARG